MSDSTINVRHRACIKRHAIWIEGAVWKNYKYNIFKSAASKTRQVWDLFQRLHKNCYEFGPVLFFIPMLLHYNLPLHTTLLPGQIKIPNPRFIAYRAPFWSSFQKSYDAGLINIFKFYFCSVNGWTDGNRSWFKRLLSTIQKRVKVEQHRTDGWTDGKADNVYLNFLKLNFFWYKNLLYISTSVWVLYTPNTGRILLFQCSCAKKLKKEHFWCQYKTSNFAMLCSVESAQNVLAPTTFIMFRLLWILPNLTTTLNFYLFKSPFHDRVPLSVWDVVKHSTSVLVQT